MSMRFSLVLFLSAGAHVGLAYWWIAPTTQAPKLPLRYGKVSVELMPIAPSTPRVTKQPKRKKNHTDETTVIKTKKPELQKRIEKKPKTPEKKATKTEKKKVLKKESPKKQKLPPPKELQPKTNNPIPKTQKPSIFNPAGTPSQPKKVGVTTAAHIAGNQKLTYPYEARRLGIEGRVVLRLRIARTGKVLQAKLSRTSGSQILDTAAIRSAFRLRFVPARRNGEYVESTLIQGFNYRLE